MNYYDILEIDKISTTTEIRKQYHKLAKIYHPDKYKNDVNKFKQIKEAYETLSNPMNRYKYDIELEFSDIFEKNIELNLDNEEIKILQKYYSKIRHSTEYRFLKLLIENLHNRNKFNKYNLIDISKYKYFNIMNINYEYTINFTLSFTDTYTNTCKILIIITKNRYYHLFITHTNMRYILNNNNNILNININTKTSNNYFINNNDIYIYNKISLYDFIFNDNISINLPNNQIIKIKVDSVEPIVIPLLGLKDPYTYKRGKLIICNNFNLLEKKNEIIENITEYDKKILYKLFT